MLNQTQMLAIGDTITTVIEHIVDDFKFREPIVKALNTIKDGTDEQFTALLERNKAERQPKLIDMRGLLLRGSEGGLKFYQLGINTTADEVMEFATIIYDNLAGMTAKMAPSVEGLESKISRLGARVGSQIGLGIVDIIMGPINTVLHPIATVQNIGHAIAHPVDTATGIATFISEQPIRFFTGAGINIGANILVGCAIGQLGQLGNVAKAIDLVGGTAVLKSPVAATNFGMVASHVAEATSVGQFANLVGGSVATTGTILEAVNNTPAESSYRLEDDNTRRLLKDELTRYKIKVLLKSRATSLLNASSTMEKVGIFNQGAKPQETRQADLRVRTAPSATPI